MTNIRKQQSTVTIIIKDKIGSLCLYACILFANPPVTVIADVRSFAINTVASVSPSTITAICTITTVSAVNAVTSVFAVCTYYITGIHQGIVSKAYHKVTAIINSGLFDTNAINAVYTVTTILAVNTFFALVRLYHL